MKDGRAVGIGTIVLVGLGLWAWSRRKAAEPEIAAPALEPALTPVPASIMPTPAPTPTVAEVIESAIQSLPAVVLVYSGTEGDKATTSIVTPTTTTVFAEPVAPAPIVATAEQIAEAVASPSSPGQVLDVSQFIYEIDGSASLRYGEDTYLMTANFAYFSKYGSSGITMVLRGVSYGIQHQFTRIEPGNYASDGYGPGVIQMPLPTGDSGYYLIIMPCPQYIEVWLNPTGASWPGIDAARTQPAWRLITTLGHAYGH